MGSGIDPAGQSGDNGDAPLDEQRRHPRGATKTGFGGCAGSHDRHRPGVLFLELAAHEEERRKVRDEPEVHRVALVEDGDQSGPNGVGCSDLGVHTLVQLVEAMKAVAKHRQGLCRSSTSFLNPSIPELVESSGALGLPGDQAPVDACVIHSDGAESEEATLILGQRDRHLRAPVLDLSPGIPARNGTGPSIPEPLPIAST